MSRRRILPTYAFKFSEEITESPDIKVKVQAVVWTKPNCHPHDGGLFKIVEPLVDEKGLPKKGVCEECKQPLSEHGFMPVKEKIHPNETGLIVCPGSWILLQNNDYWPCSPELFEELYEPLPRREWYAT